MATNRIGFSTDFVLVNSNIGIGTTNPSQKLHVAGNLRVTGGSVEIGATDSATQKFSINFNEATDSLDFNYTA